MRNEIKYFYTNTLSFGDVVSHINRKEDLDEKISKFGFMSE